MVTLPNPCYKITKSLLIWDTSRRVVKGHIDSAMGRLPACDDATNMTELQAECVKTVRPSSLSLDFPFSTPYSVPHPPVLALLEKMASERNHGWLVGPGT